MSPPLDGGSYFDPPPLVPYIKPAPTQRALRYDAELIEVSLTLLRQARKLSQAPMVLSAAEDCLDYSDDKFAELIAMFEGAQAANNAVILDDDPVD